MKKVMLLVFCMIILSSLVLAQSSKISVITTKESFKAGEKITLKVSLLDENNNPINDNVQISLEDPNKKKKIEKTIQSNQLVDIDLGEGVSYGYWTARATYNGLESKSLFVVEVEELAKFEIQEDVLKITNIGNTQYTKTIQIVIGDTVGIKEPKLGIGESISLRLIAPDGNYNVRITDGKTTISQSNVALTGKVIGVLDERVSQGSPITGYIKPEGESELSLDYLKKNKFVYVFVLVIFGATILLAIERHYKRRV
ncbi:MAG: hypothetical protein KKA64_01055 [Nanoarchaeota archaeon]|nr:hypothetical protein [Nanoarchaeota archaeon]